MTGSFVAFGNSAPVVARWRVDGSGPVTRIVARGSIAADEYDPDGRTFVSARRPVGALWSEDMTSYAIWDLRRTALCRACRRPSSAQGGCSGTRSWPTFPTEDAIRSIDARTGSVTGGPAVSVDAMHTWMSPRGDRAYVSMPGGEVLVADAATRTWTQTRLRVDGEVRDVAATADGSRVAVTFTDDHGSSLQLFDGRTGSRAGQPRSDSDVVAITDDGLLAVATEGSVSLVDADTMRTVRDLPGARGEVNDLQFSADGAVLVATSNDQTVSVYDTAAGIRLGDPLPSSAPIIYPGYLRPDGMAVLVTVAEGVAEWDLDPAHLSAAACTLAGRNLTLSEWSTYASALGPTVHLRRSA